MAVNGSHSETCLRIPRSSRVGQCGGDSAVYQRGNRVAGNSSAGEKTSIHIVYPTSDGVIRGYSEHRARISRLWTFFPGTTPPTCITLVVRRAAGPGGSAPRSIQAREFPSRCLRTIRLLPLRTWVATKATPDR